MFEIGRERPAAQVRLDDVSLRALLREQHADLSELPIALAGEGWDNYTFRVGDALAVRVPRRAESVELVLREQQWLPRIAERVHLPIPAPIRVGVPSARFGWPWSVVPWLTGTSADVCEVPTARAAAALGGFLASLHVTAPPDAPSNPFRTQPLVARRESVEDRLERLTGLDARVKDRVRIAWLDAVGTPIDSAPTWIHGDLHLGNILVQDGEISGVIDWGDITVGDVATDLAALFMLFPDSPRRQAGLASYRAASAATLTRAQGWAVFYGSLFYDLGLSGDRSYLNLGRRILESVAS